MTNAVSIAQSGSNNVTFRNRIINGSMMIDQRNAGGVVALPGPAYTYTVDRFKCYSTASSKWQAQQVSDAPAGFSYSLKLTSLSANSPAASDEYGIFYAIEGLNVPDLAYGTASASSIAVSFWVKASIAGTYPFNIYYNNGSGYQWYVTTYSIASTGTWTYITLSIPGNTSQALLATNTFAFNCVWVLGNGSDSNTASTNSWQSGNPKFQTSSCVNLLGTNSATLQITGVQLEKGSTATPFEQRLYGTELALCQRYYEKSYAQGVAPANGALGDSRQGPINVYNSSSGESCAIKFIVTKRTAPSITFYSSSGTSASAGQWAIYPGGWQGATTGAGSSYDSYFTASLTGLTSVSNYATYISSGGWAASAEL